MKMYNLLKKIYYLSAVEILSQDNIRLYYGLVCNIDKTTYNLIKKSDVIELCGYDVEVSKKQKSYIIQIKVNITLDNNIKK